MAEVSPAALREALQRNQAKQVDEPRWLTGYSDASFKSTPPQQGGGWGIWVRDTHLRVLRSGPCPDWVGQSNDVELCGVFAAVCTALTNLDANWANILVVKTDNQAVCRWFGWKKSKGDSWHAPRKAECRDLVYRALQMCHDAEIKLVVTWVKGHQGNGTTKGYLNNQVDRMAGEARKTRQKRLIRRDVSENG